MSKRESVFENKKLLYEWDWEENQREGFTPQNITMGSIKQIHWVCAKGHKWQASPNNRSKGNGCPVCAGRKIEPGYNDFATIYPELVKEWHPTKNGYLRPNMISFSSAKKVWWLGKCGHEWQASVDNRRHGNGCPICAGFQVLEGYNDLATIFPELAKEWCLERNGDLLPTQVTRGSRKKVWWICSEGHEYESSVSNRVFGRGCPVCGVRRRGELRIKNKIAKEGSLAETNQKLSSEWHPTRNGDLKPENVTRGSDRKIWWKCERGHEYEATISNRSYGKGCPICAGKKIVHGINDLETMNLQLASEWNYKRNQEIMPSQVSPNSHKKVWWICDQGHEWEAQIKSRNMGTGCPICAKTKGYKDKKNNIK